MAPKQSKPTRQVIERYYDLQSEREWERMDRHRTEFAVTMRALIEHLPPPPARVLDCGGGPGRYAIELAQRGYEITLFDLSAGNLQLAQEKAAASEIVLSGYEQGTATDLSRFPDHQFDAVLLMGPLYHLLEEQDRRQALAEARRVLKPGGPLFAAFISRYAVPRYAAAREVSWPLENPEFLESILKTGVLPPRGEDGTAFVAHFAHPTEVAPLLQEIGFEIETILGVEGLVSLLEDGVNELSGHDWEVWLDLNARVAPDPSIHGCTEHLLAVARNPRWRAVLKTLVLRMDEASIDYRIIGGAGLAVRGYPVPVNDIDILMRIEDTHRFQEIFAEHAMEPIIYRESDLYRSHFGLFDIEGIPVEVMSRLERREGEGWVPSLMTAGTTVVLEGIAVRVLTLEEAAVAHIRREKLDRAALCLPHCNPQQLLALLRGVP